MDVYKIFLEILENPLNPNPYKHLASHYESVQMDNEAQALVKLIEIINEKSDSPNYKQG